jgi:nucleoid-associated protein YgaU
MANYIAETTYTVKDGDTLWSIASWRYGDRTREDMVYKANKEVIGPDKNLIRTGQKLYLPFWRFPRTTGNQRWPI